MDPWHEVLLSSTLYEMVKQIAERKAISMLVVVTSTSEDDGGSKESRGSIAGTALTIMSSGRFQNLLGASSCSICSALWIGEAPKQRWEAGACGQCIAALGWCLIVFIRCMPNDNPVAWETGPASTVPRTLSEKFPQKIAQGSCLVRSRQAHGLLARCDAL